MNVRPRRKLLEACVAAALALVASAGCADIKSGSYENTGSRGFAQSAMSTGPLLVEIQGVLRVTELGYGSGSWGGFQRR